MEEQEIKSFNMFHLNEFFLSCEDTGILDYNILI